MAGSPYLLVPTGSLPCGPARVPSRAHPHFMGSVTYRTQVMHESEAVSLPLVVSCRLIPAGVTSFPYLGARVHFISCVHTLPVSVYFCLLFLCAHLLHTHSRHTGSLSRLGTHCPPRRAPLPTPLPPPPPSLSLVGPPCAFVETCIFFLVIFIERDHYLMTVDITPGWNYNSRMTELSRHCSLQNLQGQQFLTSPNVSYLNGYIIAGISLLRRHN